MTVLIVYCVMIGLFLLLIFIITSQRQLRFELTDVLNKSDNALLKLACEELLSKREWDTDDEDLAVAIIERFVKTQ